MDCANVKKVAVVGIGKISDIYISNMLQRFDNLDVTGYFDVVRERAENAAATYKTGRVYESFEEVLDDAEVDIVLNLTRPVDHYDIILRSLQAGKHVYSEKPLTETLEKAKELAAEAKKRGLYLASAPDTFLGAGIQSCKKLVEDGVIGKVSGACAQMVCSGWEYWHPDPDFYYKPGGGPLKDMGPYYLTALTYLMGEVESVIGMAKTTFSQRTIKNGYRQGEVMDVEVPTWINSLLRFKNGAQASLLTSFDCFYEKESRIELYGTEGTILVTDPNWFNGDVKVFDIENNRFESSPLIGPDIQNLRGLGVSEMAAAIDEGRPCAAGVDRALHIMAIIEAVETSIAEGRLVRVE